VWDAAKKGFMLLNIGSAASLDGWIAKADERRVGWLAGWLVRVLLGTNCHPRQMGNGGVRHGRSVPRDPQPCKACNSSIQGDKPLKNDGVCSQVATVITHPFSCGAQPCGGLFERLCLEQRHSQYPVVLNRR
jgi:hypothetical protein